MEHKICDINHDMFLRLENKTVHSSFYPQLHKQILIMQCDQYNGIGDCTVEGGQVVLNDKFNLCFFQESLG